MTFRHFPPAALLALIPLFAVTPGLAQPHPAALAPGHALASPPKDTAHIARDLPAGTIQVRVKGPDGRPAANQSVALRTRRQSPAIGLKVTTQRRRTDSTGTASFASLEATSEYTYATEVAFEGAVYGPDFTSLPVDAGLRITIHTFPTTRSLEGLQVGMMGVVTVEPSDSILQLEVSVDVLNIGRVTWLPEQYSIQLPSEAKAFDPWHRSNDADPSQDGTLRFVLRDSAATLQGTVRPGQHRAGFRLQVPNPGHRFFPWSQTEVSHLDFGLPPRMVRFTVLADRAKGMRLAVPGFSEPTIARSASGRPVLASSWHAQGPADQLSRVNVTLGGLRTRGITPFLSVLATLVLLGWGLVGMRPSGERLPKEDAKAARKRLLDELVALDDARAHDRIGPKTYAAARRTIILALARLERPSKKRVAKQRQTR